MKKLMAEDCLSTTAPEGEAVLAAHDLCVHAGKNVILRSVSFEVHPRQVFGIIGPSGAGKSTLIRLLIKEEMPTSGKIIVGSIDYDTIDKTNIPHLRRRAISVLISFLIRLIARRPR